MDSEYTQLMYIGMGCNEYSTKLSFQNFVSKTCGFEHKKADAHIFHVELCQKLPKSCKIITKINTKQYASAKCT